MDRGQVAACVAALRRVSDALILERTWGEVPRSIDKAVAFIHMNDASKARRSLDDALASLADVAATATPPPSRSASSSSSSPHDETAQGTNTTTKEAAAAASSSCSYDAFCARMAEISAEITAARDALPAGGPRTAVTPSVTRELTRQGDGFDFEEDRGELGCTVLIPVPDATTPGDVDVRFGASTLKVAVRGHRKQPAVIDGPLAGRVVPASCSWHLGTDAGVRTLHVDLEKAERELAWPGLLDEPDDDLEDDDGGGGHPPAGGGGGLPPGVHAHSQGMPVVPPILSSSADDDPARNPLATPTASRLHSSGVPAAT